jgi:hypothetical protein
VSCVSPLVMPVLLLTAKNIPLIIAVVSKLQNKPMVGTQGDGMDALPVLICTACARDMRWSPYRSEMWHNHGHCDYCGLDASVTNTKDWRKPIPPV